MSSASTTPAGDDAAPAPAPAKAAAPDATSAPVASQQAASSSGASASAAADASAASTAKPASDAPAAASAAPEAAAKPAAAKPAAASSATTAAKPATASSAKADSATAKASPRRKKLQLNPDVPAFQPSSPLQVHAPTFSPSWAPAVVRNSGLRPPPGVAPKAGGNAGAAGAAAPGAAPTATTGKKSRRRKRRGRKRGGADGDPRIVKITGLKTGDDVSLLKALLAQLFGPVASFSSGAAKGQKVVLLVTFENADSATKAVRSGSVNHNGVALKLMRQPGTGGSAPSNIVRLSNLPPTTTAESLAKILAKHGARASSSDMQMSPSGEFTGVVFCRYCSTDAAARAVSQLSDSVVEGHTLKATYNVPPTTAGAPQGGNAAAGGGGRRQSKGGRGNGVASSATTSSGSPFSGNRRRSNSRGSAGVATPPMPGSSGFTRLVMVPAVPHSGGSARRRRHYSEDWTSRRISDSPATRHRTSSFARGSVPEGSEGGTSTWLKRRARSLSNSAAAPPIPVHYALGPDGSVGFERVRRGRSRSVTAAAAPPVANSS